MAIVKTDSVHYQGIADAIRNLHAGEETYTPAEMAEYLAAEGTELKPENIVSGATIFGVKGTMIPEPELPPGVNEDEVDTMLLTDDKGNVTWGFMFNTPVPGMYNYGGLALPEIPLYEDNSYDSCIVVNFNNYSNPGKIATAKLFRTKGRIGYDGNLLTDAESWLYAEYDANAGVWSDYTVEESSSLLLNFHTMASLTDAIATIAKEELIWSSADIVRVSNDESTGEVWHTGTAAEQAKFTITSYNYRTTEFRAIGWIRAAYHTTGEFAGQFTFDDFRTTESGGWNYIKHVRQSTRDKLSYLDIDVWPRGPEMFDYNGHLIGFSQPQITPENYPYVTMSWNGSTHTVRATDVPLKLDGTLLVRDVDKTAFTEYHFEADQLSGRPVWRMAWDGGSSRLTDFDSVVWSSYDIENLTGGIAFEASVPVPVRMPDIKQPDSPVEASFYLYGKSSASGNVAVAEGEGSIVYSGEVLPPLPEWDKTTYPYAYIVQSAGNTYLYAVNTPKTTTGTTLNFFSADAAFVYSEGAWAVRTSGVLSAKMIWVNADVLYGDSHSMAGHVAFEATTPIPLVSSEPIRYEGDIPVYQKKE